MKRMEERARSGGSGATLPWRFGPPIERAQIQEFEAAHGIQLPEPYRSFLISKANGASGPPTLGLLRLEQSVVAHGAGPANRSLADPFPLTEAWLWEGREEAPDQARLQAVLSHGTLALGTDGDGMDYVLVVTGPARGQVWMITGEGALPIASDFARWMHGEVLPDAQWTLSGRAIRPAR